MSLTFDPNPASDVQCWKYPPAQPHILVVEDDEIQQAVLKAVLEAGGFDVETVSDGLGAMSRLRDATFDLVLLDYLLPEMDGLAIARMIRDTMGEAARPRLIALTALPDIVIGRELVAGIAFDEVVGKSVDLSEVLAMLTRHLRSRRKSL